MLQVIRQVNAVLRQSMEGLSQGVRSDLQVVLNRLGGIERRLDMAEMAISKLEDIMDSPTAIGTELHKQVEALEAKVRSLQISQVSPQSSSHNTPHAGGDGRAITAVLGGLDAFKGDLNKAQGWLKDKLVSLSGPQVVESYSKADDFGGILFAKFKDTADRDWAVSLLREAGLREGGKDVWAQPDRPVELRAVRKFTFGFKYLLKDELPYKFEVDEEGGTVKVGGELAVTAWVEDRELKLKWHGEWEAWEELHNKPDLQALIWNSTQLLQKSGEGFKGGGKAASSR